jgi:hypothetical protein
MPLVLRVLLLPAFALLVFLLYANSLEFFAWAIPSSQERSLVYATLLAQGFAAAAVVSAVFSYPLAYVYRKASVAIALVVSAPALVLRLPELFIPTRSSTGIALSIYELGAFVALLVGGAYLARIHLARSNP